jgi:hypothetical protein
MDIDRERIAALLGRVYIFQGIEADKLLKIGDMLERRSVTVGEIILSQQVSEPALYIIFDGKARSVTITRRGVPIEVELHPAEYFGEGTLLYRTPRLPTVSAIEDLVLLVLAPEQYQALVSEFPNIEEVLRIVGRSRSFARVRGFKWLNNGELIYFISRKHILFLIMALMAPLFFWVLAFPFISVGIAEFAEQEWNLWLFIGLGLFVFSPLWAAWAYVDWSNDYYVVTNQRVIWLEKIVLMYESRTEAPLDTVLATDVKTYLLGRFYDYGDVSARTYTGQVPFKRTSQPYQMASFIEGLKQRRMHFLQEDNVDEVVKAVERALEKHLNPSLHDKIPVIPAPPPASRKITQENVRRAGLRELFTNFLQVRFQQGNVITYRKHWPILVRKTIFPALCITLLTILLAFLTQQGITGDALCLGGFVIMLAYLFFVGWLLYGLVDWRNDIYRLTPEQILDIEKKPLGTEVKKSADLDNILSIEHIRLGLLGNMLNYGNVFINVGTTEFVFIGVYNPDRVHQDISDYREALRRRNQEIERAREREKIINYLVAFYDTQGKIDRQSMKQSVKALLVQGGEIPF